MASDAVGSSTRKETLYEPVALVHPSNNSREDLYSNLPYNSPSNTHGDTTRGDSFSMHSAMPLNPRTNMHSTPVGPGMPTPVDYATGAAIRPSLSQTPTAKTHTANNSSWDLLAGIRKDFEGFDPSKAKEKHLQFAAGDIPDNKVSSFPDFIIHSYQYLTWPHCSAHSLL
jgi:hypothetical protein